MGARAGGQERRAAGRHGSGRYKAGGSRSRPQKRLLVYSLSTSSSSSSSSSESSELPFSSSEEDSPSSFASRSQSKKGLTWNMATVLPGVSSPPIAHHSKYSSSTISTL